METDFLYRHVRVGREFKSYYVVWKRVQRKCKKTEKIKFKSYYVVWKLFVNEVYNKINEVV